MTAGGLCEVVESSPLRSCGEIVREVDLKDLNTFSVAATARELAVVGDETGLRNLCRRRSAVPPLVLGAGSNVLFLGDYEGLVLLNRLTGVLIVEGRDSWRLHARGGESWARLVQVALENGIPGLENLGLIPGLLGAAPIQNVGAYGVEFGRFCEYVDVLFLRSGLSRRIERRDLDFGYRRSVLRRLRVGSYIVTAVGIRLDKSWSPVREHRDLGGSLSPGVTPAEVYARVCDLRKKHLPDPKVSGNAGSFFKNPIVADRFGAELLVRHPGMPFRRWGSRMMLHAGWLIGSCGLGGLRIGGAAVCEDRASVLINTGGATGSDVLLLARRVYLQVARRFSVFLEPEVCLVGPRGVVDARRLLGASSFPR